MALGLYNIITVLFLLHTNVTLKYIILYITFTKDKYFITIIIISGCVLWLRFYSFLPKRNFSFIYICIYICNICYIYIYMCLYICNICYTCVYCVHIYSRYSHSFSKCVEIATFLLSARRSL